jgi:Uma2 family endonuclease
MRPGLSIVLMIHGTSSMISATVLQESKVQDERGLRPVRLRLSEPFESIIANNPEWKVERTADGDTIFMSPTGGETGFRNSEINFQIVQWARTNGGTTFDSSTLFRLPNGALRSPDAAWIKPDRWQALTSQERTAFPPIAPDFVIELRSTTDRLVDVREKMKEYISCGVRLGWLIDPLLRQVHVYRPDQSPIILSDPETVSDESVLPGFILDLSRIFH